MDRARDAVLDLVVELGEDVLCSREGIRQGQRGGNKSDESRTTVLTRVDGGLGQVSDGGRLDNVGHLEPLDGLVL